MFGTRTLIETHIQECKEDRRVTAERFDRMAAKTDKLEDKLDKRFEATDRLRDQQHAENQASLAKLQRYMYMLMGGAAVLSFLTSDWGQGLLQMLQRGHHGG